MVAIPFTQNLWINVHKIRTMKLGITKQVKYMMTISTPSFLRRGSSISNMHCALQKFIVSRHIKRLGRPNFSSSHFNTKRLVTKNQRSCLITMKAFSYHRAVFHVYHSSTAKNKKLTQITLASEYER